MMEQNNIEGNSVKAHSYDRVWALLIVFGNPLLDSLTKDQLRNRYICTKNFLPSRIRRGVLKNRLIGPAVPIHFQSAEAGQCILIMTKRTDADKENDVLSLPEVFIVKPPKKFYSRKPRTLKTEDPKLISSSFKRREEDDDMKYCKICLVTDCKMFSSPSINKAYSQLVQELCDYEMYVCYECKHLLIKYQEFRSKCMMALKLLSSIQIDHSKVTRRLIKDIDRKHHKLESNLHKCNSNEHIALPESNLDADIKTEMVTYNSNEQIVLPGPSLDFYIKTENDTNPDALEDDKSENNVDVDAECLFFEVQRRDTEYTNEILQPEHNFEIDDGGLFSDVETQGKKYHNEIFQLNHAPNNIVTETKLKLKCKPNSKKTKECVPKKIKTLKSVPNNRNSDNPLSYLSKKPSNYIMQQIKKIVKIDEQKCLPTSKKTKESVPKRIKTLKSMEKKGNSDHPLSILSRKPSDYMIQLIQNYATIVVMTPSEAKKEMILRKESDNYKINPHKCDLCYKGFAVESTYNNHMKQHSPDLGSEECEFCHRMFRKRFKLRKHIAGCHKYKITCKCCPSVCSSLQQAKYHAAFHKGETYTCEHCGMSFRYPHSLINHKRIKHPEHTCAHCGSMFVSPMGLRSHKYRAHKQDSTELLGPKCEECDVQFATETAWKRHLVLSSKHAMSNGCVQCGETFLTAGELRSHAKEHPRRRAIAQYGKLQKLRTKRPTVCKLCNKRLETDYEYKEHVKSEHPNTEAANQIGRRQVEEESRYICEVCGKGFRISCFLNYHKRSHTGERPYGCEQCGKRYPTPSSLSAHNKVHHSGAPRFTCDICQKSFHIKGAIRNHIALVHLGVRRFKCDICNKSFGHRYEVRMHREHVHFKKPWPKRDRTQAKRRSKEDKDTVE